MSAIQSMIPLSTSALTDHAAPATHLGSANGKGPKSFGLLLLQSQNQLRTEVEKVDTTPLLESVPEVLLDLMAMFSLKDEEIDTELQQQVEIEEEMVVNYLEQLIDMLQHAEQDKVEESSYEAILSFLTQLPITLVPEQKEHSQPTFLDGAEGKGAQVQQNLFQAQDFLKWQYLYEKFAGNQASKIADSTTSISKQLEEALSSLNKVWSNQAEWKQFLVGQMQSQLNVKEAIATMTKTGRALAMMPAFVPSALLVSKEMQQETSQTDMRNTESLPTMKQESEVLIKPTPAVTNSLEMGVRDAATSQNVQTQANTEPAPTVRMGQLLQDMKEVFRTHFQQLKSDDAAQIRIKLAPEHLGHLDIKVISENGKISAVVLASSRLAKEALELQLSQLRLALTQQGLQVDKIEVAQQNQTNQSLHQQQDTKGNQQYSQQRDQEAQSTGNEEDEFSFESELERMQEEIAGINYVV
ncbi:flagellar hook-length control protein FliK [Caldalkalibacillus mannanilyticus]|uniref:flagellar hook-length control protein FliK n=1 Tax=Caldalkalibacillus mannanilyticus TaxID=1418 RepID=UPI00046A6D38|nr:flagellar hook-length control protein FliK [Caldalkalibacillus mannanilyticus]